MEVSQHQPTYISSLQSYSFQLSCLYVVHCYLLCGIVLVGIRVLIGQLVFGLVVLNMCQLLLPQQMVRKLVSRFRIGLTIGLYVCFQQKYSLTVSILCVFQDPLEDSRPLYRCYKTINNAYIVQQLEMLDFGQCSVIVLGGFISE